MVTLPKNTPHFSQETVSGTPLLINLAELQGYGHRTLEEYLEYVFAETQSKLVLPVLDGFFPLVLVIESVDGKAISGFWQSPSCGQHCDKKERPHPCADNDDDIIDCDLFCLGSLSTEQDDDKVNRTRDLTRHSLCHTDHRGELTTCGILSITLHHHHQPNSRAKLVSIELFIGCSDTQKSVFVVQCQAGLKISLTK